MFVCVVPLSHPSSRDLFYVKCLCVVSLSQMLYVKCLCVVSLSQMLYVKCLCPVVSTHLEICYMLNVCVLSRYVSHSSRDLLYVKCLCVVSLSQPSSRDLLYV